MPSLAELMTKKEEKLAQAPMAPKDYVEEYKGRQIVSGKSVAQTKDATAQLVSAMTKRGASMEDEEPTRSGPGLTDEQIMRLAQQQATQDALATQGQQQQAQPQGYQDPGMAMSNTFSSPEFRQYVGQAALPTLMGAAGTVGGTMLTGSPIGGVVGAGLGSGIGEGMNQEFGITPRDPSAVMSATGLPIIVGGATTLARPLMPFLRAGKAAQTLNALAPEEAAAGLAKLSPRIPSSLLFKQAAESQVKVPMNRTLHALDSMIDEAMNVSSGVRNANRQVIGYLKGLKNMLSTSPEGLTPIALQRELEGAGNVIKSVSTRGGTGSGQIKKAFEAMVKDLDDAANMAVSGSEGARSLINARDAFKRESVISEIGDAITSATKYLRGQGEYVQFNANAVLKEIGKNRFYKDALKPREREEVESLLKMLNKVPALRPGAGAQFGSGKVQEMLRLSAIGGGGGALMGGGPGAAIGAAAGAAVPVVAEFGRNFTLALQMETGRALMRELLTQSKGIATPQVASIIAAYAHAVEAGQVNE